MTNPTNPFNWQMPTASDLVTDLPADFETFGQAVATSMADLLGGTTGQILSKASNTDMDFTWITNDVGDITAVNTTAPLAGGGTSGALTLSIAAATTSVVGAVQLSDSTSTTSSVLASTPTATKAAYDLANAAIAKAIVDAKGDLIGATAADTPARLAVGTNGQVLTADSTAATGLAWATPTTPSNLFYAGKNKIINGDFKINQRSFTSNTTDSSYNFDRFFQQNSGGTFTSTPQTFTPGTAPVSGYEGSTFLQSITSGSSGAGDYGIIAQRIESVRTFANQTVTVSFWAKAASGTPKIATEIAQNFGSGGSPSAAVNTSGAAVTLSTSWARYSTTIVIPSISGKTLGTTNDGYLQLNLWINAGSTFASRASSIGNQNATFQIWGVQIEAGSTATDFQTATGSIGGELALCQRYYYRQTADATNPAPIFGFGTGTASTSGRFGINLLATMRTTPTSVDYNSLGMSDGVNATTAITSLALLTNGTWNNNCGVNATTASGITTYRPYFIVGNGASGAYLGLSAEL